MKKLFILSSLFAIIFANKLMSQTAQWIATGGSTAEDVAQAIDMDTDGNTYIGGFYKGDATFGSNALTNVSLLGSNAFLVKYNNNGGVVWAKQFASQLKNCVINDLKLNNAATHLYMTGYYSGSVTFGTTTLTSAGGGVSQDIFVAKADTSGNIIWAVGFGNNSSDDCQKLALDINENIFIVGYYQNGTITFGSTTLPTQLYKARFFTKLDKNGNVVWAQRIGTPDVELTGSSDKEVNGKGFGVGVDSENNVYITGQVFSKSSANAVANFDTITHTVIKENSYNFFLAKFNNDGKALWVRTSVGIGKCENTCGLAIDNNDNILSGGISATTDAFNGTNMLNTNMFFAVKYDKNGNLLWTAEPNKGTSSSHGLPQHVTVDPKGNVYYSSYFNLSYGFGAFPMTASSSSKMFIVCFSSSGTPQWVFEFGKRDGGTMQENAMAMSSKIDGLLNVTGKFDGATAQPFGSLTATALGSRDAFNLRISTILVGLDELSHENFNLYPNPASSEILISTPATEAIVYTITGIKVLTKKIVNGKIDVSNLEEGIYLLQADGITKKVIIKR